MHGQGIITTGDCAKKYAGEFWENERNGWGVFVSKAHTHSMEIVSYNGHYKDDAQCGLGEAEYLNGNIYKGTF